MQDTYTIRAMPWDAFVPHFRQHVQTVFGSDHAYALSDLLSDAEQTQIASLGARMGDPFELCLGVFDDQDRFVGWSWGKQDSKSTFYMINSGVLPGHRRQGIYTGLINRVLSETANQGFQIVYSRHIATNNAVIIPKLQAGFMISKFELSDTHGVLVHLHYYANETRRRMMAYRSGQRAPDDRLKALLTKP